MVGQHYPGSGRPRWKSVRQRSPWKEIFMRSWSQDEKGNQNSQRNRKAVSAVPPANTGEFKCYIVVDSQANWYLFTHLQNLIRHIQLFSDPLWQERKEKSITSHPQIHVAFQDLQGYKLCWRPSTTFHSPAGPSSNKSTRSCAVFSACPETDSRFTLEASRTTFCTLLKYYLENKSSKSFVP